MNNVGAPNIVQQHPGQVTLTEQDGIFTVTDTNGEVKFSGGEVDAEFRYWQQVFDVPAEQEEGA